MSLNETPQSSKPNSTSRSLIDLLKQDQAEAWKRLFVLYEPLVRYWCRRSLAPEQEIADLVQEVFQTVAKNIGSFSLRKSGGSFRGWLRTITRSRVIDWHRRNKDKARATGGSTAQAFFADQPFDRGESGDNDEDPVENDLTQELYSRALAIIRDHFQEQTWTAFWRVVVDGRTPNEVGTELSLSPSTVRVAKSRVLHRLRLELGEQQNDTDSD